MLQFSRLEASKDAWSNGYTRRLVTEKLWVQIPQLLLSDLRMTQLQQKF